MVKYTIQRKFMSTLPKPQGSSIARLLTYAGIEESPDLWMGSRLLLALGSAAACSFLPLLFSQLLGVDIGFGVPGSFNIPFMFGYMLLAGSVAFVVVLALVYFHLYYVINDRTKRVEEVLPDFLLMVAAHMHAGLTPFAAFQSAARPEFGPLEKEVKSIASHSMGSESFTDALLALSDHMDSAILRRTIAFFENGLRSGGKLAQLLETAAEEIRDLDELQRETVLNTRTYTIFLVFILVGGLPILLAISTQFLGIFAKMQAQVNTGDVQSMGNMLAPSLNLQPDFVNQMAVVIIIGTSILVSVFIGVISEGKLLFGLKYAPPLAILAYVIFFALQTVLHGFLGVFFS